MLLILTNSLDGTSDVLCRIAIENNIEVFRFNTDLLSNYKIHINSREFTIEDTFGRFIKRSILTACLWRKPWSGGEDYLVDFPEPERTWVEAQFRTVVRDIVNICRLDGRLRLVDNDSARRADKLTQMCVAEKYFRVPEWDYVFRKQLPPNLRITKPLSAEIIKHGDDMRFVYTSKIQTESLSIQYPWLVQNLATGIRDTTVVYISGKMFHFGVIRRRDTGEVDWRANLNTDNEDQWERIALTAEDSKKIDTFMQEMGLLYGRLDFIVGENDSEMEFLEVNANGQFGWLDDESSWLHRSFLDAVLDKKNTIRNLPCTLA